ncbi:MAG TPA: sigma-70 family RNA polymerase sigma factor [Candidatus Limnocylindrales bacterium]
MDGRQGDRAIVAALVAGDPWGLDQAYRRYAPRLLAYCVGLLHDGHAAADAVQDTFLLAAQRAGQLRDADRLPAWLFAIARHECLRHVRARRRQAPLEEATVAVTADPIEPEAEAGLHAEQIRELVNAAATGLSTNDREIIELAIRHRLSVADIGAVLGLAPNHVHARLSRARAQLERAIGVLLVARHGRSTCATLDTELRQWDGRFDAKLRKRLGRHIDGCADCTARRAQLISPSALLVLYGLLPLGGVAHAALSQTPPDAGVAAPAPDSSILDIPADLAPPAPPTPGPPTSPTSPTSPATPTTPGRPAEPAAPGRPAEPAAPGRPAEPAAPGRPDAHAAPATPTSPTASLGAEPALHPTAQPPRPGTGPRHPGSPIRFDRRSGFPLQRRQKRRRNLTAALLALLLIAAACATPSFLNQWASTGTPEIPHLNWQATSLPSPSQASPDSTPSQVPSPEPSAVPSASPSKGLPKIIDPPPPPPPSPPSLRIVVTFSAMTCIGAIDYRLSVRVLSLATMTSPRLFWRIQGGALQSVPMTQTDRTHANVTRSPLIGRSIEWWVEAVTPEGVPGETTHVVAGNPCLSPSPSPPRL